MNNNQAKSVVIQTQCRQEIELFIEKSTIYNKAILMAATV